MKSSACKIIIFVLIIFLVWNIAALIKANDNLAYLESETAAYATRTQIREQHVYVDYENIYLEKKCQQFIKEYGEITFMSAEYRNVNASCIFAYSNLVIFDGIDIFQLTEDDRFCISEFRKNQNSGSDYIIFVKRSDKTWFSEDGNKIIECNVENIRQRQEELRRKLE